MSLISFTSILPLSRPFTSSKLKSPTERKQKKHKGNEKAIISSETNHTTDRIIAIITQIASRLDHIESNMGISPKGKSMYIEGLIDEENNSYPNLEVLETANINTIQN